MIIIMLNLNDLLSFVENKRRYFDCWQQSCFVTHDLHERKDVWDVYQILFFYAT